MSLRIAIILGDLATSGADDISMTQKLKSIFENELRDDCTTFRFFDNHANLINDLQEFAPDFALNLCDEGLFNIFNAECNIPALLEYCKIPYSGSDVHTLVKCFDKAMCHALCERFRIPVPQQWLLSGNIGIDEQLEGLSPLPYPIIVKPNQSDGSIGITQHSVCNTYATIGITQHSVCKDLSELRAAISEVVALFPGNSILLEEFLTGDEFTVGFIGNGDALRILPPLLADYSDLDAGLPHIQGTEAKWESSSPYYTEIKFVLANYSENIIRKIHDIVRFLVREFRILDYGRIDFRMNSRGEIKVLELNPNSSWCDDGKMAVMYNNLGLSYTNMISDMLKVGMIRHKIIADQPLYIDTIAPDV